MTSKFQRLIQDVDHGERDKSFAKWLRQRPTTWNVNVSGANIAILGCPSLSELLDYTFIELVMVKIQEFAVGISTISITILDI